MRIFRALGGPKGCRPNLLRSLKHHVPALAALLLCVLVLGVASASAGPAPDDKATPCPDAPLRVTFQLDGRGAVVGEISAGGAESSKDPRVRERALAAIGRVRAASPYRNVAPEAYGKTISVVFADERPCPGQLAESRPTRVGDDENLLSERLFSPADAVALFDQICVQTSDPRSAAAKARSLDFLTGPPGLAEGMARGGFHDAKSFTKNFAGGYVAVLLATGPRDQPGFEEDACALSFIPGSAEIETRVEHLLGVGPARPSGGRNVFSFETDPGTGKRVEVRSISKDAIRAGRRPRTVTITSQSSPFGQTSVIYQAALHPVVERAR